jgi:hypothetical protein
LPRPPYHLDFLIVDENLRLNDLLTGTVFGMERKSQNQPTYEYTRQKLLHERILLGLNLSARP